jgi:NADH-quinone oxidoreductase subunit E
MCSVNGTYVGPVDDSEVLELAEQIRTAQDPLPGKQLVRRRVADVAANTDDVARASRDTGTLDPVSFDEGSMA